MSVLFYRRPNYVARPSGPLNREDCQKYVERMKNGKAHIPPELSFENIVNNNALPPCSLQDFMDYLVYIAHDAENLQFYLWLQDYTKRFNALRKEDRALSPEWRPVEPPPAPVNNTGERRLLRKSRSTAANSTKTNADKSDDITLVELSSSPTKSISFDRARSPVTTLNDYQSFISKSATSHRSIAEIADEANAQAGLKWQSFTIQPFRSEIVRIIANYLAPGAPRELNLSYRDRSAVLHALQHTTHPSAFAVVATMVEALLRGQSHPNFIRWSICNGNKPRVFFVRTLGVLSIALGTIIALLLTLSSVSRWYRILSAIILFMGTSTIVAAYKGLCIILHHSHGRTLKPWEEYGEKAALDASVSASQRVRDDEEATLASSDVYSINQKTDVQTQMRLRRPTSMDSFGSANTYTDEPWVSRYKGKPLIRKIFDRTTWVQEESVRIIQDKIVRQSQIWALILTIPVTVVWVALPKGNLY